MRSKLTVFVLCILLFVTVIVVKVPEKASAGLIAKEEWVARYNGPQNKQDSGVAMVVDSSGNIYVTGYTDLDYNLKTGNYTTIKYSSSGSVLWIATYDGPVGGRDRAFDIALGPSGNVYVTGRSEGCEGLSGWDYATIAYDSLGNELWIARYDGPAHRNDQACAIAVDSSENVYVTGTSRDFKMYFSHEDFVTVKYDSNGNELWVARYHYKSYSDDEAQAIVIDKTSGNVIVIGYSEILGFDYDYVTIAYDSDGKELWVSRYNGPENSNDIGSDLALDSAGNIYVTGSSSSEPYPKANYDITTIKYNSSGNEVWVARYNGPGNGADYATAIITDASGNIYVTGNSYNNATDCDSVTITYDSLGNELWVARYNGPGNGKDKVQDLVLDSLGNIYVTGYSEGVGTEEDYFTVKYDSFGNEIWTARYNGPGNDLDLSNAIAVDLLGNVFVTGRSVGFGMDRQSLDWVTIKYSQEEAKPEPIIDIDPDTLNLKSKGRWITAYITLNDPFDVHDINIITVMLEDTIPAEWGDVQNDTLMVKFDRSEVEDFIGVPNDSFELNVTGELIDGTPFAGSDIIRVIEPGG